jgi:hypothetical protein
LYFSQRPFGLDGKHVINIIAKNVRICCGRAVFAASASEVTQCPSFSRRRRRKYQTFSKKYDRSCNFKWKIQRRRWNVATHSNDSDRYAFRVQTFVTSCATHFCNDHQQSTGTIATSVWTKFGKSMLLTWTTVCGLLTRWKTFRFIRVLTRRKKRLYIQKLFNKNN